MSPYEYALAELTDGQSRPGPVRPLIASDPVFPLPSSDTFVDGRHLQLPEGLHFFMKRGQLPAAVVQRIEDLAFQYGGAGDSYLVVEPDYDVIIGCNGQAAAPVARWGNCWHVAGGLLTGEENQRGFAQDLAEFARLNKHIHLLIYGLEQESVSMFTELGYQPQKMGEEPVVDLANLTWSGKSFTWIRRQENFCLRAGLVCREIRQDSLTVAEWESLIAQMRGILKADLADRALCQELKVMEGRFMPEHLGRRRVFVSAPGGDLSRIEAFLIINPMRNGTSWALEMYRRSPKATRGAMPFLMKQTIDLLKSEGVRLVSLCLVPGKGCVTPLPGDYWLARWGFSFMYKYCDTLFGGRGQEHFKSRFRPRLNNRYAFVLPGNSAWCMLSFLMVTSDLSINFRNAWKTLWHRRIPEEADQE